MRADGEVARCPGAAQQLEPLLRDPVGHPSDLVVIDQGATAAEETTEIVPFNFTNKSQ